MHPLRNIALALLAAVLSLQGAAEGLSLCLCPGWAMAIELAAAADECCAVDESGVNTASSASQAGCECVEVILPAGMETGALPSAKKASPHDAALTSPPSSLVVALAPRSLAPTPSAAGYAPHAEVRSVVFRL